MGLKGEGFVVKAFCKTSLHFYRATYMMENCEASNAKILERLNTTLRTLNTTGLSPQHVEWLNTTSNVTSGLQKCDLETFLTDVRLDLDSCSILIVAVVVILVRAYSIHAFCHFDTNCRIQ